MGENEGKHKGIENLTPFTSERQPTPEQKKKGWERRREAQKIMDEMLSLTSMSYKEIKDLLEDIKVHPENHTLREVKIANYLMEKKFTVDYLDRHISKAPQQIEMGGDMNLKITREIINEPTPEVS